MISYIYNSKLYTS